MTENSIAPALKSVRRALLDAEVNLDVATALLPGMASMLDNSQLAQVETWIKWSEAMICRMT